MKGKKSITYFTKRIMTIEKLGDTESNKLIKYVYILLKKYYTHKWEVYYDEKEKKSYKAKKTTNKRRY